MGILLTASGLPLLSATGVAALPAAAPDPDGPAPLPDGPAPLNTGRRDWDWVHTAYVGEPLLELDFASAFAAGTGGSITGYTLARQGGGAVPPHSWNGTVLTIAPSATASTATFEVRARNGDKVVATPTLFQMKAVAAPATLAAGTVTATGKVRANSRPPDWTVEIGRPVPRQAWYLHITGGVPPFRYEQIGGPAWMVTRAGGTRGRAPSSPTTARVTVRVTDQRGDSVDLSYDITVVARRSRTPTYTMRAGDASIAAAISARGLGAGDVLYIPASLGVVQPGDLSGTINLPAGNPLVILGEDGAAIRGPVDFTGSTGVICENLIFRFLSAPANNVWVATGDDGIWFYDCGFEGFTATINPKDGQSWQNAATFAYEGSGLWMKNGYCVVDNCYADRIEEAYHARGHVVDCETRAYRDDALIVAQSLSASIVNHRTGQAPSGNYLASQHQDLVQGFSDNAPTVRHLEIDGYFSSCEGHRQQGWWFTHVAFAARGGDLNEMWQHIYIGNSVCLAGTWNAFSFQRWYDAVVENCVILMHPDASWSRRALVRHWKPSTVTIRNCIYGELDAGEENNAAYMHLLRLENNVVLRQSNRAAYSTVFPGFENAGLGTFDRMRIDPGWAAAHPGVGPAMLLPAPSNTAP